MTADEAFSALVMSALPMLDTRDTGSQMVRAVNVTLRSAPMPCETSTEPRYSDSISGNSIANSTADTPPSSAARPPSFRLIESTISRARFMTRPGCCTLPTIGFVAECDRGHQETLAAGRVGQAIGTSDAHLTTMLPGPPGWQPKVPVCKLPLLSISFALMEPECLSNCCGKCFRARSRPLRAANHKHTATPALFLLGVHLRVEALSAVRLAQ